MTTIFPVGSKVVHPCYGAGTIVRIQEKSIGDVNHAYYVISTIARPMQLMVAVSRADEVRLRAVGPAHGLRTALSICCEPPQEDAIGHDLRQRQSRMRDRLKSGSFHDVADVARTLYFLNNRRPLGTVDHQLLEQGKEFLAGELALATDTPVADAMLELEQMLEQMFEEPAVEESEIEA